MMSNVDWTVIDKYEIVTGFGYAIPKDEKSGITVGLGFDLGQHSIRQIDKLPISEDLKEKLRPYTGLKGAAARNTLYNVPTDGAFNPNKSIASQIESPVKAVVSNSGSSAHVLKSSGSRKLELAIPEIAQLNEAIQNIKLESIVRKFDAASVKSGGKPFANIPASSQTSIVSFCWQYGENIGVIKDCNDRRRKYWSLVVIGDWSSTIELIFSSFMGPIEKSFSKRRIEEGHLLMWGDTRSN